MDSYSIPIWAYIVSSQNKKCCCESHCEHIDVTNLSELSTKDFLLEIFPLLLTLTILIVVMRFAIKIMKG